jgi:hypothetical protein
MAPEHRPAGSTIGRAGLAHESVRGEERPRAIVYGVGALVGGSAGFPMALHPFGGIVSKSGFACLAVVWLFTGLRAVLAIRRREIAGHRRRHRGQVTF